MSALNLDSTVVHHPGIVSADMDGETVMMNIEAGEYLALMIRIVEAGGRER